MEAVALDRGKLADLCRRYGVSFLGVFGSVAKGEETAESDVDLLVRFAERKSLLDLVRIEREMSEALGRKVDLLTEASISPHLRERILEETIMLYDENS